MSDDVQHVPNASLQNQIDAYNRSQPPPRKQNTACDACRARKVKCNRLPGQEKCQVATITCKLSSGFLIAILALSIQELSLHVRLFNPSISSSLTVYRHHIQQATSEKKRAASIGRRPRQNSSAPSSKYAVLDPSGKASPVLGRFAEPPSPSIDNGATMAPPPILNHQNLPLGVKYGFYPPITLSTTTRELLAYIFAPPEPTEDPPVFLRGSGRRPSPYDAWGLEAFRLEDDTFKAEFTQDLVEVFFQIVHTRLPLLNPAHFRDGLQLTPSASSSTKPPLHPALVATVLAWGSKFSEHSLLVADRKRRGQQSFLAKTLIDRARDLAEALKVHRIPNQDHVVIALLIEPLQSQIADDPTGFRGFWLTAATRHLLDLQACATLGAIADPEARAMMVFAWWMACFCDAYASAYYRRKPVLDDEDYDIDFYTGDPVIVGSLDAQGSLSSPREQLEVLGYYRAAHSLARITRDMSRQLWKPVTDAEGIPLETLYGFTHALSEWRDNYLSVVGVPSNFKGDWDFVSAVSSCASDATYHVMWIILFNALDDFGVKELNNRTLEPNNTRVEEVRRKVLEEALHGALRISGLVGVLPSLAYPSSGTDYQWLSGKQLPFLHTHRPPFFSNVDLLTGRLRREMRDATDSHSSLGRSYPLHVLSTTTYVPVPIQRLDPAVMHVSCIQAGTLLARMGNEAVKQCINGLKQYSYSYEEAGEQAREMERVYAQALAGEPQFSHMGAASRTTPEGMSVDDQDAEGQGSERMNWSR
ncbi:hypothetical protein H0H92_015167 [Tricholoma furcatifolium]|nr:hypothetical protein H0H92_015167 [Tricholoma furcatifolium]